jgi:hypothetical protein
MWSNGLPSWSWSHVTTDGRSTVSHVLVSSTLVRLATRYYFLSECCSLKFAVFFLWGAFSDERTGLQFVVQSLNGPSRSEPVTILYCLIWDSPNLESQVPVFISPRNRVAQLYPRALGYRLPSLQNNLHWVVWSCCYTPVLYFYLINERRDFITFGALGNVRKLIF